MRVGAGLAGVLLVMGLAPASAQAAGPPVDIDMRECGVMHLGTTGTCVVKLQLWMNVATNHSDLAVDGVYGPATVAAVREFQTLEGIAVDGAFGEDSRQALRNWWYGDLVSTPRLGSEPDPGAARPGFFSAEETEQICDLGGGADATRPGADARLKAGLAEAYAALMCKIILGP